jgi:hypothetical protein
VNNLDLEVLTRLALILPKCDMDERFNSKALSRREDDRSSLLSSTQARSPKPFVTARPIVSHMMAAWCAKSLQLRCRGNLLSNITSHLLTALDCQEATACGVVFNISNYVSPMQYLNHARCSIHHPQYLDYKRTGILEYYDSSSQSYRIVPSISTYVVVIFQEDLSYSVYSLIAARDVGDSVIAVPRIYSKTLLSSGSLIDNQLDFDDIFRRLSSLEELSIRTQIDTTFEATGLTTNEYEAFFPQHVESKQSSTSYLAAGLCTVKEKSIVVRMIYVRENELRVVEENSRYFLEGNNTSSHLDVRNALNLGVYYLLYFPVENNPSSLTLLVDRFEEGEALASMNDEERFAIRAFAKSALTIHLSTRLGNDDEDESTEVLREESLSSTYDIALVREKLFLAVSKVFPILGILAVNKLIKDQSALVPVIAYRDDMVVQALYSLRTHEDATADATKSKVSLISVTVESEMGKNRFILPSTGARGKKKADSGQISLLPSGRVRIKDLAVENSSDRVFTVTAALSNPEILWQ